MAFDPSRLRVGVLGRVGSGKTYALRALMARYVRKYDRLVVIDPFGEIAPDSWEDPDGLLEVVKKGRCLVVIDEADLWIPERKNPHPEVSWLVKYGRHVDAGILWASRRPAEVSKHLLYQTFTLLTRELPARDLERIAYTFPRVGSLKIGERVYEVWGKSL